MFGNLKIYDLVTREKANRTLQDTEEFIEYLHAIIADKVKQKLIRCCIYRKGISLSIGLCGTAHNMRSPMAKYLQRSCPKCNGYLGIVVPERKVKSVQAINGRCLKCGYRLAWVVVRGKRLTR